ncbi:MAG: signal peptidase I [Atopostipes suicloacalis]|nr:signal peptidase I [Atopostipes suicloacalis]MDN6731366.1 signal peptidase I [Atopostipes suicloacalis]
MNKDKSSLPPRASRYENKKPSFWKELLSTLIYIVIIAGVFLVIQRNFYAPVMVEGDSMEETLSDGDYLLMNRYSDIERFDVVIFPDPLNGETEEEKLFVKRVIGLPGDEINFEGDQLFLNGEEVDEKYLDYSNDYSFASFSLGTLLGYEEVPDGHYFVLGDNRNPGKSQDSRVFSFVNEESVIGKVSLRYWPFDKFGKIKGQE